MSEIPAALLQYVEGLETHDVAKVGRTVADDIAFVSSSGRFDKAQFLSFLTALYAAFPDWSYDHDPPEPCGDGSIAIKWRQGGTHRGAFVIPGQPTIEATGRVVRIPEQHFFYRVVGDRIVEIRPDRIPGGAPGGILEQITSVSHETR